MCLVFLSSELEHGSFANVAFTTCLACIPRTLSEDWGNGEHVVDLYFDSIHRTMFLSEQFDPALRQENGQSISDFADFPFYRHTRFLMQF